MWILGGIVSLSALISGALFVAWQIGKPPSHRPKPQVNVAYSGPKVTPDGSAASFVKTVTQEETGLVEHPIGGPLPITIEWHAEAFRFWSKTFLCRSKPDGSAPVALYEIASEQLPSRSDDTRPERWDSWFKVLGFDASWAMDRAVILFDRGTNNVIAVDLQTGEMDSYTFPASRYDYSSIQVVDDGSKVLLGSHSEYLGILTLNDGLKTTNIFSKSGDWFFKPPAWSEAQRVFAIEVHPQIWIFNSELDLVEQFSVADLGPVLHAKQQHQQPPEHKYAWVVDKLWAGYLPKEPKPTRASNAEFQLKTHTIPNRRINPENAATIW